MEDYKSAIQNLLMTRAKEGTFRQVRYNDEGFSYIVESPCLNPMTVLVNELSAAFDEAKLNRMRYIRERSNWRWKMILSFPVETTVEAFEENLLHDPPRILARLSNLLRQVTLKVTGAEYIHPPRQNPTTGSQIEYLFEAEVSPA